MDAGKLDWPDGKPFAFTVIDDTDRAELDRVRPVYDLLLEHGMRTTKTVWPLRARGKPITGGQTLEDERYAAWIHELRRSGAEIALHGVADETSTRERVIEGFERYRAVLGEDAEIHINHVGQREGIYWGAARFDPPVNWAYALHRMRRGSDRDCRGHVERDPHFWGDLCRERIRFVRNMVWPDINTLKMDPLMPYHDPRRPFVRHWFSSSFGSGVRAFCRLISERNQDRLAEEGGACIVYTHFGSTFHPMDPEFVRLIRRLATLGGWFVPASQVLRHVGERRGWPNTRDHRLRYRAMQMRWMISQRER